MLRKGARIARGGRVDPQKLVVPLSRDSLAVRDWQAVEWPRPVYIAAQAVIGTALGGGLSPATLLTLPKHFSIFAFAVVFILLTSLFNGWLLTLRARLDVATAFLGTMRGGAGEMFCIFSWRSVGFNWADGPGLSLRLRIL